MGPTWPHDNHQKASNCQSNTSSWVPWKSREDSCAVRGPPKTVHFSVSCIQRADIPLVFSISFQRSGWAVRHRTNAPGALGKPQNMSLHPQIPNYLSNLAPNSLRFWRKGSLNSLLRTALIPFCLGEAICQADSSLCKSVLGMSKYLMSLEHHHTNCSHGHGKTKADLRGRLPPFQFQQTFVDQCVVQCKKNWKHFIARVTSALHFLLE